MRQTPSTLTNTISRFDSIHQVRIAKTKNINSVKDLNKDNNMEPVKKEKPPTR